MATAASRRSSSSRRTALLAVGVGVIAVLLFVYLLDRPRESPARASVTHYLDEVNAVQRDMAVELAGVARTYAQVRAGAIDDPGRIDDLARARRTLALLEERVRALDVPPQAAPVHARLLDLLASEVVVATDVERLALFLPVRSETQRTLAQATVTLRKTLTGKPSAAAQQAAFARFATVAGGVAGRLEGATAPATLKPLRTEEATRARKLQSLAGDVGAAIANGDAARVRKLLTRFVTLAGQGPTTAQRDAVLAFNRRVRAVTRQQEAVRTALARLDRELR